MNSLVTVAKYRYIHSYIEQVCLIKVLLTHCSQSTIKLFLIKQIFGFLLEVKIF